MHPSVSRHLSDPAFMYLLIAFVLGVPLTIAALTIGFALATLGASWVNSAQPAPGNAL